MDRGPWSITVHAVSKGQTQLSMQAIKTYVKNLNDKGEITLPLASSKLRGTMGGLQSREITKESDTTQRGNNNNEEEMGNPIKTAG